MVQDNDTANITADEQAHINEVTDRLMRMLDLVTPTELGQSLRALADRVDRAPSLWGAKDYPNQPAYLSVSMTNGDAVRMIAADLGATVTERNEAGERYTHGDLDMGLVQLHLFAIDEEPRELHRPVDVTEIIEEQEQ